jgi:hypothetical protein
MIYCYGIAVSLDGRCERDFRRYQARASHIHRDLTVCFKHQLNEAAASLYSNPVPFDQSLLAHEPGEAAGAVSALLDFLAVSIENPIAEVHLARAGRFHQQHLIAADTEMAVGDQTDVGGIQRNGLIDPIDDDEIVT